MESAAHSCAHCGLPTSASDAYCCFGCELAAQIASEAGKDHGDTRNRLVFSLLLSMSVMMLSLFLYAEDIYGAGDGSLGWLRTFYRWTSGVLTTPVMLLCGIPLLRRSLRHRGASMALLISLASFAAYGLSWISIFTGGTAVYFESAAAALVLATFGRYLEAQARTHANAIVGHGIDLRPDEVTVVESDSEKRLAPSQLEVGMRVRVEASAACPVDLQLEHPVLEVDCSILTGESDAQQMERGDTLFAGAVPLSSAAEGVALRSVKESTLEKLSELAKGLRHPSPLMRVSDAFARWLTRATLLLAALTFAYWTYRLGAGPGILSALAVVLVACPCTYAIGAPLVQWLTLRRALQEGVLVRDGSALEALAKADAIAFDKTGTLTEVSARVQDMRLASGTSQPEVMSLLRALEEGNSHPIGRALFEFSESASPMPIRDREFLPGTGVRALDAQGREVFVGRNSHEGRQQTILQRDGQVLAHFSFQERAKDSARASMVALQTLGFAPRVLSGDAEEKVAAQAESLGVGWAAQLRPEEKVEQLKAMGKHLVFVGDGVNDAPAIASAATSISVLEGAGLTRGLAQVSLLNDDLRLVPWVIDLARKSKKRVVRLLAWATFYNLVFLGLAVSGSLRPVWAGLSMLSSSLLTVGFALRAMHFSPVGAAEPRLPLVEPEGAVA